MFGYPALLPRSPRTGWRETGPGRYEIWHDPESCGEIDLAIHYSGGSVRMARTSSGRYSATLSVLDPPAILPVWLGPPDPPPFESTQPFLLAPGLSRSGPVQDTHAHVGHLNELSYTVQALGDLVEADRIGLAWVSNLDGASRPQRETNRSLLEWIGDSRVLRPFFWANPTEGLSPDERELLEKRRFFGLKFHPQLNGYRADDPRVIPYLEVASELSLPLLFHTELSELSHPALVGRLARRFPKVRFVLGHTGLYGAEEDALREIGAADNCNVFGDIAWFSRYDLLAAHVERFGGDRFVFGSDAPIDGEMSYQQYLWIFWRIGADREMLDALFVRNPARLAVG